VQVAGTLPSLIVNPESNNAVAAQTTLCVHSVRTPSTREGTAMDVKVIT